MNNKNSRCGVRFHQDNGVPMPQSLLEIVPKYTQFLSRQKLLKGFFANETNMFIASLVSSIAVHFGDSGFAYYLYCTGDKLEFCYQNFITET